MKRWRRSGNARGTGSGELPPEPIDPALSTDGGLTLTITFDLGLQARHTAILAGMFTDDVANTYTDAEIVVGLPTILILTASFPAIEPTQISYTAIPLDARRLIGTNGLDVADFTIGVVT